MGVAYDEIGNPLTDGTWTYTWEHGRELAAMSDGTTTWTYTYDANGLRTKRTDGTITYNYVYNGGSLSQMVITTTVDSGTPTTVTLNFAYDAGGHGSIWSNGFGYRYWYGIFWCGCSRKNRELCYRTAWSIKEES